MHIAWLKTELLHPLDKGGRIRTYHMLRAMRARHRLTYLTLDDGRATDEEIRLASEYCDELVRVPFAPPGKGSAAFFAALARNVVSRYPYAVARYATAAMRHAIERLVTASAPDLIVCDFLTPAINLPRHLSVPSLLFEHNVEAAIWERHAQVASRWITRRYFAEQARRMRWFERAACHRVDHVVAVSELDRDAIAGRYAVRHVSAVATGVDTAYFRPTSASAQEPGEIVFTGSMDWMPNEDGIAWFVDQVLPRIRAVIPAARLTIVGRNPTPRVSEIARRDPGVTVTGTVPDIRPYLERAAVVVVPLRVGGGTRLKIFEAMAMERPIVSTPIGAEGLPVRHEAHCLLAESADDFARATVRLLQDRELAARLSREAAAWVRRDCSWEAVTADFEAMCLATAERVTALSPRPAASANAAGSVPRPTR